MGDGAIMNRLPSLVRDNSGSMAIEMAFTAPLLILLALGSADVSRMISRQNELQAGVAQAEQVALAANAGAATDTNTLKTLLMQSLNLSSNNVNVVKQFRCNADTALVSTTTSCSSSDVVSTYVQITLQDSYSPIWRKIVPVGAWNYNVVRTVQLS
jgi:Flp pilus assembly protein TadG